MPAKLLYAIALAALSTVAARPLAAQHDHRHPPQQPVRDQGDSAFRALQSRGKQVMGVDQYSSTHAFQDLPDGGRIELQRDVDDTAGTRVIREHLRDVAKRFTAGDFSLSEAVHDDHEIPGVVTMRTLREAIHYSYRDLPRGGEVRITTSAPRAVEAIHEFLAFQRSDHRAGERRPE
jgi:hypothetical protein